MTDESDDEQDTYNPSNPSPPPRDPPLRSTAPQSAYTIGQVGIGVLVLLIGLALTFGLPALLV